jgi:hypothetical protein
LNSGPVPTAGNTSHCAIGPPYPGSELHDPLGAQQDSDAGRPGHNCQTPEVTLYQATGRAGMELDRGGIRSKRWTDVSDCDLDHGAPTNGRGLNCAAVKVAGPSVQDRNWERQFTVVTTAVVAGFITGTAPPNYYYYYYYYYLCGGLRIL